MNDKDIKEFHDLDKLKENYKPLPYGLVIADSGINGQGLFTTRKLVRGTHLGESHYRLDGELIRTPLGGFINHSNEPNCVRSQVRVKPHYDKWTITVIEDIEEGEELTLKYTMYDPEKKIINTAIYKENRSRTLILELDFMTSPVCGFRVLQQFLQRQRIRSI